MASYTVTINGACKLEKGAIEVKTESNTKPLSDATWGIFWIDFRSNNLVLGAGAEVIFQYSDSSFAEVGYISFQATGSKAQIRLCNRQGKDKQNVGLLS